MKLVDFGLPAAGLLCTGWPSPAPSRSARTVAPATRAPATPARTRPSAPSRRP